MSDSDKQAETESERRRAPRAALRLNATIREPGRSRVGVRIIDMSTHGCRIEASSGAPAEAWVLLSVAGLESQYCRIVWRAHEFAGLEFASPIAEAVLDRLLQDQEQLTESTVSELRSIANRTHRLATVESSGQDSKTLVELSQKCAVDAVVEGLRLGDAKHADPR
ncbi:MAG: PilZ domain-containing protein [Pseudomonadota bacterium]|nr:PilZ domain-containing protein [Pseudomonadota bacterium]